jgi:hypothetical protein
MISFSPADGGVRVSMIPRVCRTLRMSRASRFLCPSSSMTNRSPVPEVKARAFCVTPRRLRVSRITLPICWVCISSPSPKCYRTGSIWADLRQISNKYSRTGTSSSKPIKFLNHSRTGTLFELGNKAKEFIEECASKSWSLPQGDFLSLAILALCGPMLRIRKK